MERIAAIHQRYRAQKAAMLRQGRELNLPVSGTFELTARCNLNCKMCYVHSAKAAPKAQDELTTNEWKRIIDDAYDAGMLYALLTGGECLLRADFKELYLYLWEKGINLAVNTNGLLLDEGFISFFQSHPPRKIQVSLYGTDEETYFQVTGFRAFSKVKAALQRLSESGLYFNVAITPSQYTSAAAEDIMGYAKEKGYPFLVSELQLPPKATGDIEEWRLSVDEYVLILSKREAVLGNQLKPVSMDCLPVPANGGGKGIETACNAGRSQFYITWDGAMTPCVALPELRADVRAKGFLNAWRNINQKVCALAQPAECKQCAYSRICTVCPAARGIGELNKSTCELTVKKCAAGICKL